MAGESHFPGPIRSVICLRNHPPIWSSHSFNYFYSPTCHQFSSSFQILITCNCSRVILQCINSLCLNHHQLNKYISIACALSISDCKCTKSGQSKTLQMYEYRLFSNDNAFYGLLLESSSEAAIGDLQPFTVVGVKNKKEIKLLYEACLKVSFIFPVLFFFDSFLVSWSNSPSPSCSTWR